MANMDSALLASPQQDEVAVDRFLSISIDDGAVLDPRTAEMLHKCGLQATFYVPASNPERPVMARSEIVEIAKEFEVGSHTRSHLPLHRMSDAEATREIVDGKNWLEDILGERVISFCYPRGKFNRTTPKLVKEAGFLGARTTMLNRCDFPKNPLLWGISSHAYSHSRMIQVRHALLEQNFSGARNFFLDFHGVTDWQRHFAYALDYVEENGGIAHMLMHSWEVDELGTWDKIADTFESISRRGFTPVTNGDLYRKWSSSKVTASAVPEQAQSK